MGYLIIIPKAELSSNKYLYASGALFIWKVLEIRDELNVLNEKFNGSKSKKKIGEQNDYPTIWSFLWSASGSSASTYGPTISQLKSLENTKILRQDFNSQLLKINSKINKVTNDLEKNHSTLIDLN